MISVYHSAQSSSTFPGTATARRHLLDRSGNVDRVNGWLEQAWARGWATRPTLDPQALWQSATRSAPASGELGGRDPADTADFRERLEALTDALASEAKLNPLGLTIAHGQLVRIIRQRLRLGRLWQCKPALTRTALAEPVIVVGNMRSGTTRIHRLLAADPAFATTRFCDSWNPVPELWPDLRPVRASITLAAARWLNPWLDAIHPFGAASADEELGWLAAGLDHSSFAAQWRIPSYVAFCEARSPAPVYREFARILATDAAHHRNGHRPRVLKVPQFAEDLAALVQQFPTARLIIARRRANDILASTLSLVANQMTIQSDAVDLDWVEREWRRKIVLRDARMAAALANFAGPRVSLDFSAVDSDWEREIDHAYAALGLYLSPAARRAMQDQQQLSRRSPHRAHAALYRAVPQA